MFLTYFFVLLLLQRVDVNLTISRNTIAHFMCCKCDPYPKDCCIGSLILPYIILTSGYCAENCKTVLLGTTKNVTIIRVYKHPHYRNYVLTGSRTSIIKRNDVALVHVTNDPKTETPYLKLSALQVGAIDGRKGLFPVFNDLKPTLLRTIVQRCRKGTAMSSMGFVICTVNKSLNTSHPCQQQQGVPLLIEGKIIALSGFVDKLMCLNEQKYFMAVGPALVWMRSVIEDLSDHNTDQEHSHHKKHNFKTIIKKTYYVTSAKNPIVLDHSLRANIFIPIPDLDNSSQEATTTDVVTETENEATTTNVITETENEATTTDVITQTEIAVKVDQDTSSDTSEQDANNLVERLNLAQIQTTINLRAEDEIATISSSPFPTTNFFDFLTLIGYNQPGIGQYYSFRKSLQNVSSKVT